MMPDANPRGRVRRAPDRCRSVVASAALATAELLAPDAARAAPPMYFLETFGQKGDVTVPLLWGLLGLSVFVVFVVSVLVLIGIARGGRIRTASPGTMLPVGRATGAMPWIYGGLIATAIALIGFASWTIAVMAAIDEPAEPAAFTIEVTGQQWWWEARYVDPADPSRQFVTANELHIPVGKPVHIKLISADVIHSFWVPALSGKTDVIPGQTNETWLQADHKGVYRGQCAEYCGVQHAHMAFRVFADAPEDFAEWWDHQLQPAKAPAADARLVNIGQQQFVLRCGACHAVRGTSAGGERGPDLTHLMDRTSLAAVTLPNTIGHLSGWIADPQQNKPGSKMPNLEISGPELTAIRTYLATLD
ncbi:cytochrome c oxidase subunit II [Aurantimonas sp. VKM B-3413]|uniref:cytochrome c oxidase subunit II n=1 Tax=Aurantimonas sp. VKM B-3413 TaxID=2779401 RepID=UPI001E2E4D62|nr:cytochrome c oxidase subunit II [Aurantimonas sp. VKM B-3413]MCB8837146.1 cytochrome c oxidase subunit II [Aurantimonas sp. VKM B-3413]